ncbi:MAG: hypothetical protein PQJ49_12490 [Sphaerochaetaceae bacterium]|nr:hypothetical protein [Sphaerochaetaceae bacterium]
MIEIRELTEDSTLNVYNYEYSLVEMRQAKLIDYLPRFNGDGLESSVVHSDRITSMAMALNAQMAMEKDEFIKEFITNNISKP